MMMIVSSSHTLKCGPSSPRTSTERNVYEHSVAIFSVALQLAMVSSARVRGWFHVAPMDITTSPPRLHGLPFPYPVLCCHETPLLCRAS